MRFHSYPPDPTPEDEYAPGRRERALGIALALCAPGLVSAVAARWILLARLSRVSLPEDAPSRPWAIVLGARVCADGTPSPGLRNRLEAGLALYRAGRAARVLVSGTRGGPSGDETGTMQRWLWARGIPSECIASDPHGFRTRASLERGRRVFGIGSAHLCTQPFHLPRALYWAHAVGMEVTPVAALSREVAFGGEPLARIRPTPRRWFRDHAREAGAWSLAVAEGMLSHHLAGNSFWS